jgi:hypothetical protein
MRPPAIGLDSWTAGKALEPSVAWREISRSSHTKFSKNVSRSRCTSVSAPWPPTHTGHVAGHLEKARFAGPHAEGMLCLLHGRFALGTSTKLQPFPQRANRHHPTRPVNAAGTNADVPVVISPMERCMVWSSNLAKVLTAVACLI